MTRVSDMSITELLDPVLRSDPDRSAVVAPSGSLTYGELDALADAAAAAFQGFGVGRGDRVAASLPNDLDITVAFHGAMRLGAIWVGVNRNLAVPEKEALLEASAPKVVLCDYDTADTLDRVWRTVRADPTQPGSDWSDALSACAGAPRLDPLPPQAPAGIAFTSGTTGAPKGIVHSQHNLLLPAVSIVASRGYDETLRKGDCLPLTILNLQVLTTLLTISAGGCCVLTDRRDAGGVSEWIQRESVTVWNGVPAILYSMLHDASIEPRMLSSLMEVWTGGGPCPEELYHAFRDRFGLSLRQTYGLTEAPTVVTQEPVGNDHVEGSAGTVLPHLQLETCDDEGNPVVPGELGEIVVKGVDEGPWAGQYTPMLGFWRGTTIEPYEGERLFTGDIGLVDRAGNLVIRDRKKLLILRGGANVYPAEVERVIEAIPGVRASAVLGLPDQRLGQRVVAAIECEPDASVTPEGVKAHCSSRLARYKVPEEVVQVEEFTRNAMGKIQRETLAALFSEQSASTG